MDEQHRGGCACGAVRYTVKGAPLAMVECQCRQCQRESGTGHASHLVFTAGGAEFAGAVTFFDMVGDSGTRKRRAFCPVCGAPVYMLFPDATDVVVIRAASLDDPAVYAPQYATWTDAAQGWDRIDPAIPAFGRMPPG